MGKKKKHKVDPLKKRVARMLAVCSIASLMFISFNIRIFKCFNSVCVSSRLLLSVPQTIDNFLKNFFQFNFLIFALIATPVSL